MAIGGRHSTGGTTTNQLLTCTVGVTLEEARDHDGMCVGGILPLLRRQTKQQKQTKIKIHRDLRWPLKKNNQQKHAASMRGEMGCVCVWWGAQGKRNWIILGAIELEYVEKLK